MQKKPQDVTQKMVLEEMCMLHKIPVDEVYEYEKIQIDKLRMIEKAI